MNRFFNYNDSPSENGNQMGPFYEMESVSPAAMLKNMSHFLIYIAYLILPVPKQNWTIVWKVLGISLGEIKIPFH